MPGSAAGLLDQADVADHHVLVHGLDHVVDRQRRNGHGCQRFHLDAGLALGAHARLDAVAATGRRQLDADVRQRQRMTQRDERGRLLGGHDSGQPCRLQRIAFGHLAAANQRERRGAHRDLALRQRFAAGHRLRAHVHHARLAAVVEVRQFRCAPRDALPRAAASHSVDLPAPDRTRGSRATPSDPRSSA